MVFIIVLLSLLLLIVSITYFKVNAFLSFLIVSMLTAVALGIPLIKIPGTVEKGIAAIMGGLTLIIVLGAMLGKIIAESGAAENIATVMVRLFGVKHLQWGMAFTGFVVGIPLFYGVGFVLLVPLIFSIVYKYKLSAVYIGLPMLAALSVTHGFIPPHPSPVALVVLFGADMGMTLIYGLIVAIPAIIIGGPIFGKTLGRIKTGESEVFQPQENNAQYESYSRPTAWNSFITALLPVFLLVLLTILPYLIPTSNAFAHELITFFGSPAIVMLIAIIYATFSLGIYRGRSMKNIMGIYTEAVKDIAMILLIIAGSGVFKQVMEESGVSVLLAQSLQTLPIHPLILAWTITAIIRGCVGSATVAALTAASVLLPLMQSSGVNPNLMVLAIGAGSLMFSHVNDAGFWMFKEYFGLTVKDTLRSWSVMEALVSIVGLLAVLLLSMIV
ncbi:gluconate:H+ symporter [Sphingobacterium psychroaquaticum]|uniref:Gnt-I system high-affinity gluconate transporter n=1 Tax=Sphingobacterium psychroaquaticum TaxID=561061 RepID=A0A1X7LC66_9SPHI|nr:gluconate:H+ symporter [Sphingobacterium psychroaquaticum]SMG51147.1 Gnt-I system high-affinity gluconate transporter [Sphingobacterium psychroaquaticum]